MEANEISMFVTVGTFLGIFTLLIAFIPPQFFIVESGKYRMITPPEHFESVDVEFFAEMYDGTVPTSGGIDTLNYDLGGWHFRIWGCSSCSPPYIAHGRYDKWWIFVHHSHFMDWYYVDSGRKIGIELTPETIDREWNLNDNCSKFLCKDGATQITVYFHYDRSVYSNCEQAWKDNNLKFLSCINFDQQNTGMNAWNLIGMLLFFSLPQVHPLINAVIAIPLWIMIAYLTFSLILKVIKTLPFT